VAQEGQHVLQVVAGRELNRLVVASVGGWHRQRGPAEQDPRAQRNAP